MTMAATPSSLAYHMPHIRLLEISGEDRFVFLQGLLSNDMRRVEQGQTLYAALATPQGKYLHDFWVCPAPDARIWLQVEASGAEAALQKLRLYSLRKHITLRLADDYAVLAGWVTPTPASPSTASAHEQAAIAPLHWATDPRDATMGWRAVVNRTMAAFWPDGTAHYEQRRLQRGLPASYRDMVAEQTLLLEAGLDDLHAVDFHKGCYVGQEVTTRSKFRGAVRKGFATLCWQAMEPPPPTLPIPVIWQEKEIGELRSYTRTDTGFIGLAMLRLEPWAEDKKATISCFIPGNTPVMANLPEWKRT